MPEEIESDFMEMLRADKNSLSLECSDLDLMVRATVSVRVQSPGAVCVRAGLLQSIVNALPESEADEVTLEQVKNKLRIVATASIYELGALESNEFPPSQKVEGEAHTLEQVALVQMLFSVAGAIPKDGSRHVLNGVNLTLADGSWTAVATNGRQLHRIILKGEPPAPAKKAKAGKSIKAIKADKAVKAPAVDLILPAKAVKKLLQLLPVSLDESPVPTVTMKANSHVAEFCAGNLVIQTKLVEGQFPNWRQAVPADGKSLSVPRAELAAAAARVKLIDEHCVISLANGFSKITAASKDAVDTAQERLAILEAEPFNIKLQVDFLLAALQAVPDAEIKMVPGDETSPLVLKSPTLDWLGVITPMRQT